MHNKCFLPFTSFKMVTSSRVAIITNRELTNFNKVFHNIDLVWNKEKISFYIDKKYLVFETSLNNALGELYPFNEDFYLILNVAIGGNFVQEPVPSEICSPSACDDSQKLIIDYVRYYK